MMEFMEFTFQSLWHFIGVTILAAVVLEGIAAIIDSLTG